MQKSILAVCDAEAGYASHFVDYLSQPGIRESFPFEVQAFTDETAAEHFCEKNEVQFLLVSQPFYESGIRLRAENVLVLTEEAAGPPGVPGIRKYQPMESMVKKIMELSVNSGILFPAAMTDRPGCMKLIGIYSPVRRCLQTTFSFTLGQLLARNHKVLYLNFESFSGLSRMLRRDFQSDLSDLIYLLHNRDGRFPYRIEGMTQKINGLDMIPPAFSAMDLQKITPEEWLELLLELEKSGRYEYVILDLSENIQGLLEILKKCIRVYTIIRDDGFAMAKLQQYEELLESMNCSDILQKTRKCRFPLFRSLPEDLENMTRGELAEMTEQLIAGDLYA